MRQTIDCAIYRLLEIVPSESIMSMGHSRSKATRTDSYGNRLLYRHDLMYWVQGLRGRLQAVERVARRRLPLHRDVLRQYDRARFYHLASREFHRASRAALRSRCGRVL